MKYLHPIFLTICLILFGGYLAMAAVYVFSNPAPETQLVLALTALALPPAIYGTRKAWQAARKPSPAREFS